MYQNATRTRPSPPSILLDARRALPFTVHFAHEPGGYPIPVSPFREHLREIIFEADTPAGKAFDLGLIAAIVCSVVAIMLESVASIAEVWGVWLRRLEWMFTIVFSVEYALRLYCVNVPRRYAFSFFGIVDLLSILPTWLSVLLPGSQSMLVIRTLRLIRIFRVLKLSRFLGEANVLGSAILGSFRKVTVFLGTLAVLVLIIGTAMYLIEGEENGFTSIPRSVYWAVVTMTTVGYGDITPQTVFGQIFAASAMILGYSIIAVPTGIVTAEIVRAGRNIVVTTRTCPHCVTEGHDTDAKYCKSCGEELAPQP